jgi:glycine C-acetyltransferase
MITKAGIIMFDMMRETTSLQDKLHQNTDYFRNEITKAGFTIKPSKSAIIAIMLFDARLSQDFASRLLEEGIYVIGFYYPVVPKGEARIRVQISAAHSREHLDKALQAFIKVGKELKVTTSQ